MKNPYWAKPVKILGLKKEGADCKLFILDQRFNFRPGQFIMAGIPGFGEAPFSLCAENEICVRRVGNVTAQMHRLKRGDKIFVRGPYGKGWPKVRGDLLIVGGGCGIIALRPLLTRERTIIFYGARRKNDLLFRNEHKKWKGLHISVEPKMVTDLFDEVDLPQKITAFLCGPPIMYKFVVKKLKERGVPDGRIYLSLERRMHCGLGICQHCAVGPKYVCTDGPVFNLKDVSQYPF